MRRSSLFAIAAALLGLVAAVVILVGTVSRATLTLELRDAQSRLGVWDSTIRLQDRAIRGFTATSYRFTGLRPGTFDLYVSAPCYESAKAEVRVRPGSGNAVVQVFLVGYAIPGLSRFASAAGRGADGLELKLNPVDAGGKLIKNFPCMGLGIAVRVSAQVKSGALASARGQRLFEGKADWTWDAAPDAVYRYRAIVPGVLPDEAANVVIDYTILVPDPRKISPDAVDALLGEILRSDGLSLSVASLRSSRDKFSIESGTLWDVRNATGQ